jgi:hypothetical protein
MKNSLLFFAMVLLVILLTNNSCTEEKDNKPCNGYANISFTNKTDSTVQIEIDEAHSTFQLNENYIKSVMVEGDKTYKINIIGRNISRDTTFPVSVCGNIQVVILR